jgi:thiol-disulfide isomerase/thioredoxin
MSMNTERVSTIARLGILMALVGCTSTPTAPRTHDDAPIVLNDEAGARYDVTKTLADGESVALVFWQTWCVTCRAEGPDLVRAAKDYAGKIEFFGVVSGPDAIVDASELQTVTAQLALPYPQIRDRDGSLAERFHVQSTPTIIVLGRGGKELYRGAALPKDWGALAGS